MSRRIELQCDYPSYMGQDSLEDRPGGSDGDTDQIPAETHLELRLTSNKPLLGADIRPEAGTFDWVLSVKRWKLTPHPPG